MTQDPPPAPRERGTTATHSGLNARPRAHLPRGPAAWKRERRSPSRPRLPQVAAPGRAAPRPPASRAAGRALPTDLGPPAWRRPQRRWGGQAGHPEGHLLSDHFVEALPVVRRGALATGLFEQPVGYGLVVELSRRRHGGEASVTTPRVGRRARSPRTTPHAHVLLLSPRPRGLSTAHEAANGPPGSAARQKREGRPRRAPATSSPLAATLKQVELTLINFNPINKLLLIPQVVKI